MRIVIFDCTVKLISDSPQGKLKYQDFLLEQDVDAVLRMGSIAESADIHARAEPDVLERAEGLDGGFGVGLGHAE